MGQQFGSEGFECGCQEGFLGFCGPEDPEDEKEKEYTHYRPAPRPPEVTRELTSRDDRGDEPPPKPVSTASSAEGAQPSEKPPARSTEDDDPEPRASGATPPPDQAEAERPPSPGPFLPPPAPSDYDQPSRSHPAPPPPAARVTEDDVLSDLETSERKVYREAFVRIAGQRRAVAHDDTNMRDFLVENTILDAEILDLELYSKAPEGQLDLDSFVTFLRETATQDSEAVNMFVNLAGDGESIAAEECRTSLTVFIQRQFPEAGLSEDRLDRVLNTVMLDADMQVSLDKWLGYCKTAGRIVRALLQIRA